MTAGVGTSMPYSGITSTLPKEGEMGFPDMGGRSVIALKSLSSPRPPAGKGAAEAILVRPASKGASARECLEGGQGPQTN
jgi:hypothetical protein